MAVNLNPKNITEFLTGLPISWLSQETVGQANAEVVGYFFDYLNYLEQQAVQARYPLFTPQDAYGYFASERNIIKGYNDGYNVSPSLDGYLYPARLKGAFNQWRIAGTAAGILTQLHYQGIDGYLAQQNGLIQYLDPSLVHSPVFFSKAPQFPITITVVTGGSLATASWSWSYNGSSGSIPVHGQYFEFQIPGTTTIFAFNQANYLAGSYFILNTQGQLLSFGGALDGQITETTGPQNALKTLVCYPNPGITDIPHFEIDVTLMSGDHLGNAVFDVFVPVLNTDYTFDTSIDGYYFQVPGTMTWLEPQQGVYNARSPGMSWVVNPDGTIVPSNIGNPVLLQNSAPFFTLDTRQYFCSRFALLLASTPPNWTNILSSAPANGIGPRIGITNNTTSSPSTNDINTIYNIINTWKPAKATFMGIFLATAGEEIGFPIDTIMSRNTRNGGQIGPPAVVVQF